MDFLFFMKIYLNDSVHFVREIEGIKTSKEFSSFFKPNLNSKITFENKNNSIKEKDKEKKIIDSKIIKK